MDIFETLNFFFAKVGCLDDDWSPYMVSRFLSMHPDYRDVSFLANKYVFFVDKIFLKGLFFVNLPRMSKTPFLHYIKSKEEKELEYKSVLDRIKMYYKWSDRELGMYADHYIKLFEDKSVLQEYMQFFGVEDKEAKYGKEKKRTTTQKTGKGGSRKGRKINS